MPKLKVYQVDAFTSSPFRGNPAAVCLLPRGDLPLSDATRQSIAAEMNLSETAFVECSTQEPDDFAACNSFRLRWFTPTMEVPLCGHATLAAAAALFEGEGNTAAEALHFDTLSGRLSVALDRSSGLFSMDLPLLQATSLRTEGMGIGSDLVHAVVGEVPVEEVLYEPSLQYLLIVLQKQLPVATQQAFEGFDPDFAGLRAAHTGGKLTGVIVTLAGDAGGEHHFYSRFFGPWAGIDEDPVTGSAHSILGPYWASRLGVTEMRARQCSKRGGELGVQVQAEQGRVRVSGSAVIMLQGHLLLSDPL